MTSTATTDVATATMVGTSATLAIIPATDPGTISTVAVTDLGHDLGNRGPRAPLRAPSTPSSVPPGTDGRPLLVLHVDQHKTGTTAIQDSLMSNPVLERDGYTYLGMRNPPATNNKLLQIRSDLTQFRDMEKDERRSAPILDRLRDALAGAETRNGVISSEDFSLVLDDDPGLKGGEGGESFFSLLKPVVAGCRVLVLVGYRRYHEWLVSDYNQRQKHAYGKCHTCQKSKQQRIVKNQSFAQWYRCEDSNRSQHRFTDWVYDNFKRHFDHVELINMHSSREADLLADLYCHRLPSARHSCRWRRDPLKKAQQAGDRANPSVPLWPRNVAALAVPEHGHASVELATLARRIEARQAEIGYDPPPPSSVLQRPSWTSSSRRHSATRRRCSRNYLPPRGREGTHCGGGSRLTSGSGRSARLMPVASQKTHPGSVFLSTSPPRRARGGAPGPRRRMGRRSWPGRGPRGPTGLAGAGPRQAQRKGRALCAPGCGECPPGGKWWWYIRNWRRKRGTCVVLPHILPPHVDLQERGALHARVDRVPSPDRL